MAVWFTPLSRWFGVFGAGLALLTGFMTFTSVFMRAFLQMPIPGDVELTQMGIALAISMCLPWCQSQRGHILVDFFTQKRFGPKFAFHGLGGLPGTGRDVWIFGLAHLGGRHLCARSR